MADFMGQLLQTGNEALAVDFGIGAIAYCAGICWLWAGITGKPCDGRGFWITFVAAATLVFFVASPAPFVAGRTIRTFFFNVAMPAVGWLSFMALVLLAGAALGYMARRSDLRRVLDAHKEAASLPSLGERKPAITQTGEPALATRQTTAIEVRHVR